VIETDRKGQYPSHEQKEKALLSVDGLDALHALPVSAADDLQEAEREEMGKCSLINLLVVT